MTSDPNRFDLLKPGLCGTHRGAPIARPLVGDAGAATETEYLEADPSPARREGETYDLSHEAAEAMNVALALGQPLLVTGEPGCGKTALAYGVAWQLGLDHVWRHDTQSTATADELFYRFDHLRRFHDASLKEPSALSKGASDYVELQAMGSALLRGTTQVVLLDEIDKAPRDLPNDLLCRIEEPMFFTVREVPGAERVRQRVRHLVIITSNGERELPEPFLRRCVYLDLAFPSKPETLIKIVQRHLGGGGDARVVEAAVTRFLALRKQLEAERPEGLARKPSTSELIAWTRMLQLKKVKPEEVARVPLPSALLKHRDELDIAFPSRLAEG